ncbi:MAG: pseudouridine synthase [Methylococcales bacterium]|nr:pseudouridine synthase [Methylococcales bacterium]
MKTKQLNNPVALRNKKQPNKPASQMRRENLRDAKKKAPVEKRLVDVDVEASKDGERIQKVLARGGLASRREIERWIAEGRLKINGNVVTQGAHLKAGDYVQLNDRVVHWEKFERQPTRVLIYHKPTGEIVSRNDPQGRPTIFANLPKLDTSRWISVGRLDVNTSGLLLVTNNGELANKLMHPSTEVEREYAVRILGEVPDEKIELLKQGVMLEDGLAKFDQIYFMGGDGANKWYHVVVSEGRNRLVRRLWEAQNVVVSRLMRVRYGPVVLSDGLRTGKCYELDAKELALLFEFAGLPVETTSVVKGEKNDVKTKHSSNR